MPANSNYLTFQQYSNLDYTWSGARAAVTGLHDAGFIAYLNEFANYTLKNTHI